MDKLAQKENKTLSVGALIPLCLCVCVFNCAYIYIHICMGVCEHARVSVRYFCLLIMYVQCTLFGFFYVSSYASVTVCVCVCVCVNSYIIRLGRPVNGGVQSLNYASIGAGSQP